MINVLIIFFGESIQAADDKWKNAGLDGVFGHLERPKASLYQIENGGDYLFVVHADCTPCYIKNGSLSKIPLKGKDARLFKGPIENLQEIFCSTAVTSAGTFSILTSDGTLSIDKKQWEDRYENVFNLISIKREDNNNLFSKINFSGQASKNAPSQNLEKAGLPSGTDLAPKSRLYRVEDLNKYFFVGYNKVTYYVDVSGNFKSRDSNNDCHIPREGYAARIFFGDYPQLNEVLSLESFYPGQSSSLGPYHLICLVSDLLSSLNLLKNQWTNGNVVYKIVHIKKLGNEEFYKKNQTRSK